jgi:hypothetical protein
MGTIQYNVHRELLQQRINEGTVNSWVDLKTEERKLVQDPVLTRFDNYYHFFNFEWRKEDSVNSFLLQLSKKESLLSRSFFKTPAGDDDHEAKIAFVWSRAPESHRREIMRNGSLQTITLWSEFERVLRNAETAAQPAAGAPSSRTQPVEGPQRNKRQNSTTQQPFRGYGKRQDRKNSTQGFGNHQSSPLRADDPPTGPQAPAGWQSSGQRNDNRPYNDSKNGYQKPHWKNRNNYDDHRAQASSKTQQVDKPGNDKP